MNDVVDLGEFRSRRDKPDADCVRKDEYGVEMQLYTLEYDFSGGRWSIELWAYSMEEAELRVIAMRESLILLGQVVSIVPA